MYEKEERALPDLCFFHEFPDYAELSAEHEGRQRDEEQAEHEEREGDHPSQERPGRDLAVSYSGNRCARFETRDARGHVE